MNQASKERGGSTRTPLPISCSSTDAVKLSAESQAGRLGSCSGIACTWLCLSFLSSNWGLVGEVLLFTRWFVTFLHLQMRIIVTTELGRRLRGDGGSLACFGEEQKCSRTTSRSTSSKTQFTYPSLLLFSLRCLCIFSCSTVGIILRFLCSRTCTYVRGLCLEDFWSFAGHI